MSEWKERAEKAEAALADLRSRCSASVLECIYQFPNVGEYVAQMERELAEARGLLTDCVRLLSYPREAYDAGEVLLGRNNAERFLAARPAPAARETLYLGGKFDPTPRADSRLAPAFSLHVCSCGQVPCACLGTDPHIACTCPRLPLEHFKPGHEPGCPAAGGEGR